MHENAYKIANKLIYNLIYFYSVFTEKQVKNGITLVGIGVILVLNRIQYEYKGV